MTDQAFLDARTDGEAIATMKHSVISALIDTCQYTGLTIDKSGELIDSVVDRLFRRHVIWAVEKHLQSLNSKPTSEVTE
jgi:hypothetical protein